MHPINEKRTQNRFQKCVKWFVLMLSYVCNHWNFFIQIGAFECLAFCFDYTMSYV